MIESMANLALEARHSFPVRRFKPPRPPPSHATATHEVMSQFDGLRKYHNRYTNTLPGGTSSQKPRFVLWR